MGANRHSQQPGGTMKRDGIEAATKLLELKLITEQQFAELVIKSLNGHAAPAMQQQLPLTRKPTHRHLFTIQQVTDMVDMYLMGKSYQQIAETLTVRYDLTPVTDRSISTWIQRIRQNDGHLTSSRYQRPEWRQALATFRQRLL